MNVCIYVRKCCEIFSNLVSILNFLFRVLLRSMINDDYSRFSREEKRR